MQQYIVAYKTVWAADRLNPTIKLEEQYNNKII